MEKTKTISKGKRGDVKPVKINDEVGQKLIAFVENNNLATLKEMQAFLSGINVTCSQQTISSFLNLKSMSLKLSRVVPKQRNSQSTIDKRYDFVQWIINGGIQYDKCIYVDECGYNLWLQRSYGRSSKGERCFRLSVPRNQREWHIEMKHFKLL